MPTVAGNVVMATFTPEPAGAVVSTDVLRFMYEGEPECVLYNGNGGPDNSTAIAASPFYVKLNAGVPSLIPATPCATMVKNATTGKQECYFGPEPCSSYSTNKTNATGACPLDHCCWDPITNLGECVVKGSKGCNRTHAM
jgi:hypothetical protein